MRVTVSKPSAANQTNSDDAPCIASSWTIACSSLKSVAQVLGPQNVSLSLSIRWCCGARVMLCKNGPIDIATEPALLIFSRLLNPRWL